MLNKLNSDKVPSSIQGCASQSILIVDDDQQNRKLLSTIVNQLGYQYCCAESGQIALDLLVNNPQLPDLALVDVMMPDMDGFELTHILKANPATRNIPVILVTSLSDRESRLRGLMGGAEEFINKPIDRLEISIRIRNLLRLKDYNDLIKNQAKILEKQVELRTQELRGSRLEIVRSLGRAAEYRDNEMGMHIVRMSHYSQVLARAYGLNDEDCELILDASPMHDIGKVGIPDNVLLKKNKLDTKEWNIMKTHTTIGHSILSGENPSKLIECSKTIALYHHECWDGSGYPEGLKGRLIPIEARIVAIADVFDALISERPYKPAWPVAQAVEEIENLAGKKFTPELVELFKQELPSILSIKDKYQDNPETTKFPQPTTKRTEYPLT